MEFKKYQHIERYGKKDVEGILNGTVYIQPKIDGANASLFLKDNGEIGVGCRNRELSATDDYRNLYKTVVKDYRFKDFFRDCPTIRLYGEWLVPHTIKNYKQNAWKKLYIFDAIDESTGEYIEPNSLQSILDIYKIDYIPNLAILENPTYEEVINYIEDNKFLLSNKSKVGEGIIVKNYNYKNKFGVIKWAKILSTEMLKSRTHRNRAKKEPKVNIFADVYSEILSEYATSDFILKEFNKLEETLELTRKDYPLIFEAIFKEFVIEETYNIISDKKFKGVTLDFGVLKRMLIPNIKELIDDKLKFNESKENNK